MSQKGIIRAVSFLLTFIAGFTDTTTFVAADKLLSAHVTGNFIIFAYDLLRGADRRRECWCSLWPGW